MLSKSESLQVLLRFFSGGYLSPSGVGFEPEGEKSPYGISLHKILFNNTEPQPLIKKDYDRLYELLTEKKSSFLSDLERMQSKIPKTIWSDGWSYLRGILSDSDYNDTPVGNSAKAFFENERQYLEYSPTISQDLNSL